MLNGIPLHADPRGDVVSTPSVFSAYCEELQRVAQGLCDMIAVSRPAPEQFLSQDREALRRLIPPLTRLTQLIESVLTQTPNPTAPSQHTSGFGLTSSFVTPTLPAQTRVAPAARPEPPRPTPPSKDEDATEFVEWVRREFERSRSSAGASPSRPLAIPRHQLLDALSNTLTGSSSIQGTTGSMPLTAVFAMIEGGRKSGWLHVQAPQEKVRFLFDRGVVVASVSEAPPPGTRIGDLLVRLGFVDELQIQESLDMSRSTRTPLGECLTRAGMVTTKQLEQVLQTQLLESFERLSAEPEVAYAFVPESRSSHDGKLQMRPRELLLESARRADEQHR
ncbi:MAG: DUF4388 domain-containing protein [Planctomycetota bacterium]